MRIKNLGNAIKAINSTAQFTCEEDNLDNIVWLHGTTPIAKADIETKIAELDTADADAKVKRETDKTNAKAKLIAGEPLTEDEADTIVL